MSRTLSYNINKADVCRECVGHIEQYVVSVGVCLTKRKYAEVQCGVHRLRHIDARCVKVASRFSSYGKTALRVGAPMKVSIIADPVTIPRLRYC